jgi:phosphatidylglycerophosphatase A
VGGSPEGSPSAGSRPLVVWISTILGVGYAPLAPGTWGSLVAVLSFPFIASHGVFAVSSTIVFVTVLGVWASDRAEPYFGKPDDGRIVIDEVAGQWIALLPLLALPLSENSYELFGNSHQLGLLVTGFVLFRGFDIWKPGPVRWAERGFRGGLGVMADDVVAGVLAALVLILPTWWLLEGASA